MLRFKFLGSIYIFLTIQQVLIKCDRTYNQCFKRFLKLFLKVYETLKTGIMMLSNQICNHRNKLHLIIFKQKTVIIFHNITVFAVFYTHSSYFSYITDID